MIYLYDIPTFLLFRMATLRAEPQDIQFCEMKQDERTNSENTVRQTDLKK